MTKKYFFFWLLILRLIPLDAQQNPFDLTYRLSKTHVVDTLISNNKILNKKKNPLDVVSIEKPLQKDVIPDNKSETSSSKDEENSKIISEAVDSQSKDKWSNSYSLWFLPLLLILLAVTVNMDRAAVGKLFRSAINVNFLNLMYRDQRFRYNPQNILFSVIFILGGAYFLVAVLRTFFDIELSLFYSVIALLCIYLARHLVMQIIQFAFPGTIEINQFNYTIFVLNIFLGLFLIPIDLVIGLDKHDLALPAMYIGCLGVVLFYIYRLFRGLIISLPVFLNNKFRFFVYLCTLEIAPIFLVIRIFQLF